jgi:hypothetical protein
MLSFRDLAHRRSFCNGVVNPAIPLRVFFPGAPGGVFREPSFIKKRKNTFSAPFIA